MIELVILLLLPFGIFSCSLNCNFHMALTFSENQTSISCDDVFYTTNCIPLSQSTENATVLTCAEKLDQLGNSDNLIVQGCCLGIGSDYSLVYQSFQSSARALSLEKFGCTQINIDNDLLGLNDLVLNLNDWERHLELLQALECPSERSSCGGSCDGQFGIGVDLVQERIVSVVCDGVVYDGLCREVEMDLEVNCTDVGVCCQYDEGVERVRLVDRGFVEYYIMNGTQDFWYFEPEVFDTIALSLGENLRPIYSTVTSLINQYSVVFENCTDPIEPITTTEIDSTAPQNDTITVQMTSIQEGSTTIIFTTQEAETTTENLDISTSQDDSSTTKHDLTTLEDSTTTQESSITTQDSTTGVSSENIQSTTTESSTIQNDATSEIVITTADSQSTQEVFTTDDDITTEVSPLQLFNEDSHLITAAAFRLRGMTFFMPEIFLGVTPILAGRNSAKKNYIWHQGTYNIAFNIDTNTSEMTLDINPENSDNVKSLSYHIDQNEINCPFSDWKVLELKVQNRLRLETFRFSNITINGNSIQDLNGADPSQDEEPDWTLCGADFSSGLSMTGNLEIEGYWVFIGLTRLEISVGCEGTTPFCTQ